MSNFSKSILPYVLSVSIVLFSCITEHKTDTTNTSISDTEGQAINFHTSDSIQIFGTLYEHRKEASSILLFHQGGSNYTAEYRTIIPKLVDQGFNILAIDQRVGGQIYGDYNKTVANMPESDYGYCDAYPDLEAALNYMISEGFTGKKIVWGSSYSASLAIQLAHKKHNDVDAVLAFSPASGDQLKNCLPNPYFETLKVPMLLLRPKREAEFESVQEQLKLAESFGHKTYVAEYGVHGSSMLVEHRVEGDVTSNWKTIYDFLNSFK